MPKPDLAKLLKFEQTVWQSVINNDGDALFELFSDDYIEVTVAGNRLRKDLIVENSPTVDRIESYEISQASIVNLGQDAAMLSYHLVLMGYLNGDPIDPPNRWVVSVWRNTGNKWQCCFFQQTKSN